MRRRVPSLRPSQIADLLRYLTGKPINGEVVRCWIRRQQLQAETWCDMEIHRVVLSNERMRRAGRPEKLPPRAVHYLEQIAVIARYGRIV